MTKFFSGPAHNQILSLSNSPPFLRVTKDTAGKIDALDQVDDTPRADEQITVYRLKGRSGGCFIDGRDKNGKRYGRFEEIAEYVLYGVQPLDSIARDVEGEAASVHTPGVQV